MRLAEYSDRAGVCRNASGSFWRFVRVGPEWATVNGPSKWHGHVIGGTKQRQKYGA